MPPLRQITVGADELLQSPVTVTTWPSDFNFSAVTGEILPSSASFPGLKSCPAKEV
jgi:hypothetical protein